MVPLIRNKVLLPAPAPDPTAERQQRGPTGSVSQVKRLPDQSAAESAGDVFTTNIPLCSALLGRFSLTRLFPPEQNHPENISRL
ncbi:uncharacterized protein LOC113158817 isoform X2 [Anabas testudineus]|uniref:uncharacterized protein LOC113158817 isoform X2 n=1 Tax=Anabas testudineus TaxID=64144 RepID=UPI000E45FF3D|nr:uncharacterized protein LOC113158817 isoform X2 [Anabas testudineus]